MSVDRCLDLLYHIDMKKFYENKAQRISLSTRMGILADFWPFSNSEEKISDQIFIKMAKKYLDSNYKFHAAALCMYANLLHTGFLSENNSLAQNFKLSPEYSGRKIEGRKFLSQKPKYKNYTKEQIDARIEEITMRDVRNCFLHGNFDIRCKNSVFDGEFVLYPTQSEIVSKKKIIVSFEDVFNKLGLYMQAKALELAKEEQLNFIKRIVEKKDKDENDKQAMREFQKQTQGRMMKEIIIPTTFMALTRFYADQANQDDENILKGFKNDSLYIENALLAAMLTYNQNDYYNTFGKESNIFKAVTLVRNSLAHNWMEFSNDGSEQILKNQYKTVSTELKDDFVSVAMKMDIIDSQMRIKKSNPEAENFIEDDFLNTKFSYEELYGIMENMYKKEYGEDFIKIVSREK